MSAGAVVTILVLGAAVVVAVLAYRSKQDGESFEHAYQRILNTDEHKERMKRRLAGLEDTPKPAAPPEGEAAGRDEGGGVG